MIHIYLPTYLNIFAELKTNNNILRSHNCIRVYGSDSSLVYRKQINVIFYLNSYHVAYCVRSHILYVGHTLIYSNKRSFTSRTTNMPLKRNTCTMQDWLYTRARTQTTLNIDCRFQSPYNVINRDTTNDAVIK